MLLIIDNYDSFTFNLVQRFGELAPAMPIEVYRNDRITVQQIAARTPSFLVISPGPCTPRESGVSIDAIRQFAGQIPILGICLGHQCIGQLFGGTIVRSKVVVHGKTSLIHHDGCGIFADLANPFAATRYHSLIVDRQSIDESTFEVCAWTSQGEIMGLRHRQLPIHGVQFHPESFLTVEGPKLLGNFLRLQSTEKGNGPGLNRRAIFRG